MPKKNIRDSVLLADEEILFQLEKLHLLEVFLQNVDVFIENTILSDRYSKPNSSSQVQGFLSLQPIKITPSEYSVIQKMQAEERLLSSYDCATLAIAKNKGWILLSTDSRLRKIAIHYGIVTAGLIWAMKKCDEAGDYEKLIREALSIAIYDERVKLSAEELRSNFSKYFE